MKVDLRQKETTTNRNVLISILISWTKTLCLDRYGIVINGNLSTYVGVIDQNQAQ